MLYGAQVLFVNKSFCLLFWLLSLSVSIFAQIPTIICPSYFQYFEENSRYIGKIALPNVQPGVTRLEVHLSQPGVVPTPNPSSLSLYDSQAVTVNKVQTAQPILYRVEFPKPHIPPKLTFISVNGAVVCYDQDYPAPSSQVKLTHTLEMSGFEMLVPYSVANNGFNSLPTGGLNGKGVYGGNPFLQTLLPPPPPPQQQHTQQPTHNINFFNPYANFGFTGAHDADDGNVENKAASPTTPTADLNEICGRESAAFTPLIRGGSALKRGQFPWLTAIYRKKGTDLAFICGGSLLSARTVISAAHCFQEQHIKANKILLLLGRHNLATIGEEGSVHREVQSLTLHPDYNSKSISDADIAILQLEQPVGFTPYIAPICLWDLDSDVSYIVGYTAMVAGWGAAEEGEPVSLVPKKSATQIVDDSSCRNSLQRFQTLMSTRTICTRNQGGDGPCTGDSGGGLMMLQKGRWLLRGIISAGLTRYGQCTPNENFYFCDVAKHLNWIRSQILT